jgi:hypothetical protein
MIRYSCFVEREEKPRAKLLRLPPSYVNVNVLVSVKMTSVHPSRLNLVPDSNTRPTASDHHNNSNYSSRDQSRPSNDDRNNNNNNNNNNNYERRASPSYESYDRIEARRAADSTREEESRRREREDLRRERESRDDERERRGIQREERRATPERELSRGGYQGQGGYRGGRNDRGAGGGEDFFES